MKYLKGLFLCLALTLSVSMPATTDDPVSDSIRRELPKLSGKELLDALKQLSSLSQYHNDKAYNQQCINDFIAEARRQKNVEYEGDGRMSKMAFFYNTLITDSLIHSLPGELDFFRHHEQWERYYYVWKLVIEYYAYDHQYTLALDEADKMMKDAQDRQDRYGTAYSNYCLGLVYTNMDNYDQAMQLYEKCLQSIKPSDRLTRTVCYSLCDNYYQKKDYAKLLEFTDVYLDALRKGNTDMTEEELLQSSQATPYLLYRAGACIGLKRLDEAKRLIDQATPTARKRPLHWHHLLMSIVDYHLAMGQIPEALQHSKEAVDYADKLGMEKEVINAKEKYAIALTVAGNYREAAGIWEGLYRSLSQSNAAETQRHLNELATLFELDKVKREGEQQKQHTRLVSGAIIMTLFVVALLIIIVQNKRWNKQLEAKNEQLRQERNRVVEQNKQLAIERDHAEAANRAKTAFIQSMTHEIRTPLNAISGFTQVLATPGLELPPEELHDFSMHITENTRLLTDILDSLILISDLESSDQLPDVPEDYPVMVLCAQATDTASPHVQQGVALNTELNVDEELVVNTRPRLILLALDKLLDNAAKFTEQGSITLSVCLDKSDDGKENLHFSVTDTGPGVPIEEKEHIFERFAKLDSFKQGAGLGLSVARMVAIRFGGSLTLDTDHTGGTKFDFIIPFSPAGAA